MTSDDSLWRYLSSKSKVACLVEGVMRNEVVEEWLRAASSDGKTYETENIDVGYSFSLLIL